MNGVIIILLQELCLIINVLICFGIPIGGFLLIRKKGQHLLKPFLVGMSAFFISQILIRLPILQFILPHFLWFERFQYAKIPYFLFLGFTAGIFEETARLIFFKLFLKDHYQLYDGLAFGLGHGGIEAMLLVGLNAIAYLILNPLGKAGLETTDSLSILAGGIERIFAITYHVGATLLILYGIRQGKSILFTLFAILLHGILDSGSIILLDVLHFSNWWVEICLMFFSTFVLLIGLRLFGVRWKKKSS